MLSYLIRGALLVDGSGNPPCRADLAVRNNLIVAVEEDIREQAGILLEADGLVLAPGFIDLHSHTDATLALYPDCESKLFQGVTTEVTGNCGLGCFPLRPGGEAELADYLYLHDFTLPMTGIDWHDLASYAEHLERTGSTLNMAPLVGHAPLRIAAIGMVQRPATTAELEKLQQLLAKEMQQGAWGVSTGLIYPPGSAATTVELLALARTVAAYDGIYASHIRNEGDELLAALDEAIAIGRESGARVQVSHLKAMGRKSRGMGGELLARLASARGEGVDIGADQYPYAASATSLTALLPQWAHDGGPAAMLQRLHDRDLHNRLEADIDIALESREGGDGIMVSNCRSERNRQLSGKTIAAIASAWGCTAAAAVIRLLAEESGAVGAIFFSMDEEDVQTIMADPEVATGSDGHGLNAAAAAGEATHPRSYGTFPRVLGRYVRDSATLSMAAAIRKMTSLPASRLGITDRGVLRAGLAADLVLFDPARIIDCATFAEPHRYAAGIVHLLVNGTPVLLDGKLTGAKPGKVLRRGVKLC